MFSSLVILAEANTDLFSKSYLLLSDHTINLYIHRLQNVCKEQQQGSEGFIGMIKMQFVLMLN